MMLAFTSQFFQNPDSFPTNRITATTDVTGGTSNVTSYVYDETGSRIIKKGRYGEVLYVNSNYTVRNNDLISSHIYAGNIRVATRLVARQEHNGTYTDVLKGIYYYHGDHLGSSSVVTQTTGGFHEHIEYFPYGETWVQDKVSGGASTGPSDHASTGLSDHASAGLSDHELPYRYTAKEQDTETGLYYYGARYYDPQVGRWMTVDPILNQYLNGSPVLGVFNPTNLNLYIYCRCNPIGIIDHNGEWGDDMHGGKAPDGVYYSAIRAGFTPEEAEIIAEACMAVDYDDNIKPTSNDQSWHFNTNNDPKKWGKEGFISTSGTDQDSRIIHAREQSDRACERLINSVVYDQAGNTQRARELKIEALKEAGKGAHPLGDVDAHDDASIDHYGGLVDRWTHYGPGLKGDAVDVASKRKAEAARTRQRTDEYFRNLRKEAGLPVPDQNPNGSPSSGSGTNQSAGGAK